MFKLFKKEETYTCSICDKYVNPQKIHVMIGFSIIPYNLLFFHFKHYITFLEILENSFKDKDNKKLERFLNKTVTEIDLERKVAENQGLGFDFEKDLSEIRNFLLYQIIKKCQEKKFTCKSSKEAITIQECFSCELGRHQICTRKIFFSIKDERSKRLRIEQEV